MLSYKDKDTDAFEMLYRRYEKPLLDFIYRLVMNATEAENLYQETFYRVIRAKEKYKPTAQFKTWLFQIAINLCRDRRRKMKHRSHLSLNAPVTSQNSGYVEHQELVADPSPDIAEQVESEELESLVKAAVSSRTKAPEHINALDLGSDDAAVDGLKVRRTHFLSQVGPGVYPLVHVGIVLYYFHPLVNSLLH